jgi:hypothetical protein
MADGPNRSPAWSRGLPSYQGTSTSQLVGLVVWGGTGCTRGATGHRHAGLGLRHFHLHSCIAADPSLMTDDSPHLVPRCPKSPPPPQPSALACHLVPRCPKSPPSTGTAPAEVWLSTPGPGIWTTNNQANKERCHEVLPFGLSVQRRPGAMRNWLWLWLWLRLSSLVARRSSPRGGIFWRVAPRASGLGALFMPWRRWCGCGPNTKHQMSLPNAQFVHRAVAVNYSRTPPITYQR